MITSLYQNTIPFSGSASVTANAFGREKSATPSIASFISSFMAKNTDATAAAGSTGTAIVASVTVGVQGEAPGQTLEEFKADFTSWLDSVPKHPSQMAAHHSVSIHDNVFQRMMDDPEYNEQIRSELAEGFMANFIGEPAFITSTYDADGVYSGTAGGSAYMDRYAATSRDAVWKSEPRTSGTGTDKTQEKAEAEKKAKKKKELEELLTELSLQRRQQYRQSQELYQNRAAGLVGQPATTKPISVTPVSLLEGLI